MCRLGRLVLLVLISVCAASVSAQTVAPADSPAMQAVVGAPTLEDLLQKMAATLASVETLDVRAEFVLGMGEPRTPVMPAMSLAAVYAKGPRFAVAAPGFQVFGDGEKATIYAVFTNQYSEVPYKDEPLAHLGGYYGVLPEDVREAGNPAGVLAALGSLLIEPTVAREETLDLGDCWVVVTAVRGPLAEPETPGVPITLWLRKDDGMPLAIEADVTALDEGDTLPAEAGPMTAELRVKQLRINEPVSEDLFVFHPPFGAEKVESLFASMAMGMEEFALSGKPAPGFSRPTLAGETLSLGDPAGQVVVLDFWSSSCDPCMSELPHIQELWEEIEGSGVAVVGVNRDATVAEARAAVEEKGLTFPIVLDPEGEVGDAYLVDGIPCLVLIGPDGVIVGRFVGYQPGIEEAIREEIAKILGAKRAAEEGGEEG